MDVKTRKAEQSEATRRALLDVARGLFTERGYADTPTEEIVQRARVTRGALYHHFRDKQDLFRAVFEELEQELVQKVGAAAMSQTEIWQTMIVGTQAFLDACVEPAMQRIVLLDAPSVLGWEAWREIDERYGLGLLRGVLEQAMEQGVIDRQPLDPLAHMLLGAMNEGALHMARAADVKTARAEVGAAITRVLEGLRVRGTGTAPKRRSRP